MTVKVFVLGRPGTGKSTAARLMVKIAREHRWNAIHIDDYGILHWMFQNDHFNRFKAVAFNGFDVVDVHVFDEALVRVRERVMHSLTQTLWTKKLVVIEFARSEYKTSLEQFGRIFLQDSYFLFLSTDIDTCFERVEWRTLHRRFEEDHYIAKETLERLYAHDDIMPVATILKTEHRVDERRIKVIENVSSEQVFLDEVRQFIESIITQEMGKQLKADTAGTD